MDFETGDHTMVITVVLCCGDSH